MERTKKLLRSTIETGQIDHFQLPVVQHTPQSPLILYSANNATIQRHTSCGNTGLSVASLTRSKSFQKNYILLNRTLWEAQ